MGFDRLNNVPHQRYPHSNSWNLGMLCGEREFLDLIKDLKTGRLSWIIQVGLM